MTPKILLLLDEICVRNEVIEYSLELAKRMEASLILLLLLTYDTDEVARIEREHPNDLKSYIKDKMLNHMEKIHAQGIHVEAELRIGDPSSELLKFLAEIGSIQTIVWGGKTNVCNKKEMHKKSHWLLKIRSFVECPIMFPIKDEMEN